MLKIRTVHSVAEKFQILQDFNWQQSTWIVSDLQSKLFLRDYLHTKNRLVPDQAIMRASDIWTNQFLQKKPEWQMVAPESIAALIKQELTHVNQNELHSQNSDLLAEVMLSHLNQFVAIFAVQKGFSTLNDYLYAQSVLQKKWGHWFRLCWDLWSKIETYRVFPQKWSAALLNSLDEVGQWQKNQIIVDLGFEIKDVEIELLQKLAKHHEILVLEPLSECGEKSPAYVSLHQLFPKSVVKAENQKTENREEISKNFLRMTTPLAEIKDAVAKIRELLEQGVEPKKIAICAPKIENYWPILQSYLNIEGIGANKSLQSRLVESPFVQVLLSQLNLQDEQGRFADLEQSQYHHLSQPKTPFAKFRYLYENQISDEEKRKFQIPTGEKCIEALEFLEQAQKFWPRQTPADLFEECCFRYLESVPSHWQFSFSDHVSLFEKILTRSEKKQLEPNPRGVSVLPVFAADYCQADHLFLVGLTEDDLANPAVTEVEYGDVLKVRQDCGFTMSFDQLDYSSELDWISRSCQNVYYYFAESGFDGRAQAPSLYWLKGAKYKDVELEKTSVPEKTRWDEIHQQEISQLSHLYPNRDSLIIENSIAIDLGHEPYLPQPIHSFRFSASTIESYFKCPFIVATKKGFGLNDEGSVDFDFDPQKKGQLMHKIFELLKSTPAQSIEDAVEGAFQSLSEDKRKILSEKKLWDVLRNRFLDLARSFREFDAQWSRSHPNWSTFHTEPMLELSFDLDQQKFVKESLETTFIAFIDRVDIDEHGNLWIIDYKSSMGGLSHYKNWMQSDQLQLTIYSMMAEVFFSQDVVASSYQVIAQARGDVGFINSEKNSSNLASRFNSISTEAQQELYNKCGERIKAAVEGIRRGLLHPQPSDYKTCDDCRWKKLCRAPHLN